MEGSWGPLSDEMVLDRLLKDIEPRETLRDYGRRLRRVRARC